MIRRMLVPVILMLSVHPVFGWVYPEHREISVRAIQQLDPARKADLEGLWAAARIGHEERLSAVLVDPTETTEPTTIDFAAWPAIAGDHSCSAGEMLHTILNSDWILDVAAVAARLNEEFAVAGFEPHRRTNALRGSDLSLLRADPGYASRAGANSVHFLLARPHAETDEESYVESCLAPGIDMNAIGAFAWYHLQALHNAYRLSVENVPDSAKNRLALAALSNEAYALHFLQDSFAAGHVAGTRGDASQRKGTHDYYNEHGLEGHTWAGKSVVLKGDAWMRVEDAERASDVVRSSLTQVLDAVAGRVISPAMLFPAGISEGADTMNTCDLEVTKGWVFENDAVRLVADIIKATPVPGLAAGEGELPRFRSEVGPFIGFTPACKAGVLDGGFGNGQTENSGMGTLELGVRIGLGLAGVLSESGDGLVCLDLGFRQDAAASTSIYSVQDVEVFGEIFSAIPSRTAFTARLRVPFWLVPFDLLLTAPILLPTSPDTYSGMASLACNGGLLPWQAGIATSFGRFQTVLGREVSVSLYGFFKGEDRIILPVGDPANFDAILADMRSVQLEFPVIEYRPFRTFSMDQTSSLVVQLFGAVDIPTSVSSVIPPDSPSPDLRSVWQVGLRVAFDWRYYW